MATELSTSMVAELRPASAVAGSDKVRINALSEIIKGPATVTSAAIKRNEKAPDEKGTGLEESVKDLNEFAQTIRRNLQFSIDDESGRTVIKVVDGDTEEVIRQIPREETLALMQHLRDKVDEPGLIFEGQV